MSNELKYSTGSYTRMQPTTVNTIYVSSAYNNGYVLSNTDRIVYDTNYKPFSYDYYDFFKPVETKKENEYVVDLI